jgi:predicted ATP-grasp superfamily ATP-dependent carboligase
MSAAPSHRPAPPADAAASGRHSGRGVLILSGYNIRAVVAFCRWAGAHGIACHLVARDAGDPIFLTAYRERVLLTRTSAALTVADIAAWIAELRGHHGYRDVLLLPSTEFLNRFMLAQRAALEAAGAIVPLCDAALYQRLSDKYSFGQLCADAGIPVPAEHAALPDTFPFVAKPRSYAAISARQLKPYLIHDAAGLARFRRHEDPADYYYQQFVTGRSLYLLAYCPRNGAPVLFSQENLIQQKDGGSIILARVDDFHHQPQAAAYVELLASTGFHGLVMIEVRQDPKSGQCYMIEANPRLWGPMQLVVDHAAGIFDAFLRDYGFEPADHAVQAPGGLYFWCGGLADGADAVYHGFSPAQFTDHDHSILRSSLVLRDDTMPLFRHELAPATKELPP